jgi:hypothetical protein
MGPSWRPISVNNRALSRKTSVSQTAIAWSRIAGVDSSGLRQPR